MPMKKLFVLGDSISNDYGVYLKSMLNGEMNYAQKKELNETTISQDYPEALKGMNGGDSQMVLEYLSFLISKDLFHYDLLLLNCGLHDVKRNPSNGQLQISIEAYEANLRSVIQLIEPLGVRMYWVRTTPVDDEQHNERMKKFNRFNRDVLAYNGVADRIMAEAGIPSIDLNTFTSNLGDNNELFCDHVHFTDQVREQQAAFIAGHLYAYHAAQHWR
jgi:lysophospholipase L1-like esterase